MTDPVQSAQEIVDLRSDTVTRPSQAMRAVMMAAPVGDDVFGDDPTVNALEERLAGLLGHEAALFMPSGTMANQVSLYTLGQRGDELIIDANAHIVHFEAGAAAALTGLQLCPIESPGGILDPVQVRKVIRPANVHMPRTRIIALENTHNYAGGTVYPLETTRALIEIAHESNLLIHLDGARLWNAHAAGGIALNELAQGFDSVSVSFSKGLGCPVGSAILGSREFITGARRTRKMYGGGMRQVGILAAAADWALDNTLPGLKADHARARKFSDGIHDLPGIRILPDPPPTNIIVIELADSKWDPPEFLQEMERAGVWMVQFGTTRIRAVFHLDVDDQKLNRAINIFRDVFGRRT